MAYHEIETQRMGKMQFNAMVNRHTIIMDAPPNQEVKKTALFQNYLSSWHCPVVPEWM